MKNKLIGAVMLVAAATSNAGGTATITCSAGQSLGSYPVLTVSYTPSGDVGMPGLFWLGAMSPDQSRGAVLGIDGQWAQYQGGLYPPHRRFDGGMPGVVSVVVPLPRNEYGGYPTNTAGLQGYSVFIGHGVLTPQAQQQVQQRRSYLNSVRAERIAAGKWRAEYDDDDQYRWSLIQKDMTDKGKYGSVLTVPFVDCAPPSSFGG